MGFVCSDWRSHGSGFDATSVKRTTSVELKPTKISAKLNTKLTLMSQIDIKSAAWYKAERLRVNYFDEI